MKKKTKNFFIELSFVALYVNRKINGNNYTFHWSNSHALRESDVFHRYSAIYVYKI